jgi:hypothetical protein
MRRKVLQDIANTLCQMGVGWRMGDDWERIASMPDGSLEFDLLAGHVTHSSEGKVELWVAGELRAWLQHRLEAEGIDLAKILRASLTTGYRTDRIRTDRKKIVSFDFECRSELRTDERAYEGKLVERHVYHQRVAV